MLRQILIEIKYTNTMKKEPCATITHQELRVHYNFIEVCNKETPNYINCFYVHIYICI